MKWNDKGKRPLGWTCFSCWACALCDHPWQLKQVVPCLPPLKYVYFISAASLHRWSSLSEGNGMKVQQENVLPFTAGRAGFSKGQWSPNQWASHPASSFPSEPLSATFGVFWLFHKKKNCGQMVGLPVTFYLVWKHTLPFLRSCSTRWSSLFKSASFWSFCRVSSVFSTRDA